MQAKTKLLLYELMWFGDSLMRPTLSNLSANFEQWARGAGLLRTIQRLEAEAVLETKGRSLDRIVRLTSKGQRLLSRDRDPQEQWSTKWDGVWRMVIFDVPEAERLLRGRLRKILVELHFGSLQKSVYLSPFPQPGLAKLIRGKVQASASLLLLESREMAGANGRKTARAAWDFERINQNYREYLDWLEHWPRIQPNVPLEEGLGKEKELWDRAIESDPLLPQSLLPDDYLGQKAWKERSKAVPKMIRHHFDRDKTSDDRR